MGRHERLAWQPMSRCGVPGNLDCDEIAELEDGGMALRSTRDPGTVLRQTPAERAQLIEWAKSQP